MSINKIRISTYDAKWSKKARGLRPYCEYCGATENLNAHHYIRRSVKSTRLFLPNAVILCAKHHVFNHEFSAHKTPEKFKRWFKKMFPDRLKEILKKEKEYMTEKMAIEEFKLTT